MHFDPELTKAKIKLPTPAELLGDLDIDPESLWVEPPELVPTGTEYLEGIEGGPQLLLRETEAHADLIYHFTKQVVSTEVFTNSSAKMMLNDWLYCSLEAFLVVAYINGYEKWMAECKYGKPKKKKGKKRKKDSEEAEESEEDEEALRLEAQRRQQDELDNQDGASSDASDTSVIPNARYTHAAMGTGKYKGWKDHGYILYNMVYDVLKDQRKSTSILVLKNFQDKMKKRFKEDNNGSKRANHKKFVIKVRTDEEEYYLRKMADPTIDVIPL